VEFALVAPLLLLLLFGMISYGYMLSFRQAISQASAEGARAAAVAPVTITDGERIMRATSAVTGGLGGYGVSCTATGTLVRAGVQVGMCGVSTPQACAGSAVGSRCVEVSVDYWYAEHSLIPSFPGLGIVLPDHLAYSTEAEVTS
jgi:Flp pilus assembly protein TadG